VTLPTPTPHPNLETQRFWDATLEGRLELPRCTSCEFVIWYPRELCPECGSTDVEWFEASGRGEVYSFSVTRRMPGRWGKAAPFVLAYVELDEGRGGVPPHRGRSVDPPVPALLINGERYCAPSRSATAPARCCT
jgi:uncharacterized OB-fold protein